MDPVRASASSEARARSLPIQRRARISEHPRVIEAHRRGSLSMAAPGLLGLLLAPCYAYLVGISRLDVALFALMYGLTQGVGLCVGYHRHFSHGALRAGRRVRVALAVLGSMASQGSLTYWVAVHRRHHECTDAEGDPHSPRLRAAGRLARLRGLWHGHFGWTQNSGIPLARHYCPDLLRCPDLMDIQRRYRQLALLGLLLPALLGGVLAGSWQGALGGFLIAGCLRIFVGSNATWCLNSICHSFGRRPHDTDDGSTNVWWLAIPTMGESWHNNHHAQPWSAQHGQRWWQLDPAAWVIRALELAGLATEVRRPPRSR